MGDIINVKHSANSGDVIYTQWTCKRIWELTGKKVRYHQWIGRPGIYYDGAVHPVKDDEGTMVTMNMKMFEMLKPLMESLPWIDSFVQYTGKEDIQIDLDTIRDRNVNMPYGDIRKWYGYVFADVQIDIAEKIFSMSSSPLDYYKTFSHGTPGPLKKIIINRTERYRNEQIDYGFLSKYSKEGEPIYFAGTKDEFNEMAQWVEGLEYLQVSNFYQLAWEISICRDFIVTGKQIGRAHV